MEQIEIRVGKKIEYKDKHGICKKSCESLFPCDACILRDSSLICTNYRFACREIDREDKTEVYFPEIEEAVDEKA